MTTGTTPTGAQLHERPCLHTPFNGDDEHVVNTSMAGSPWLDEAAAAAQLSHAPCQPAGPRREHAGQRRAAKALRVRHRRRGPGSTCPTSRQLGAPAGAASVRAAARTRRLGLRRKVAAARVQAAVAVAAGDGNCWRQLGRVGDSGGDCRLAAAVRATATAVSAHQRRVVGEAVSSWQLSWTSAGRQLGWKLGRR